MGVVVFLQLLIPNIYYQSEIIFRLTITSLWREIIGLNKFIKGVKGEVKKIVA